MSTSVPDSDKSQTVTCIVIGAGQRGQIYSSFALDFPDKLKVIGVVDPREVVRHKLQKDHNIPDGHVFDDWKKLILLDKFADAVIISTPDHLHRDPAVACADVGYHILLEKPMATTEQGCRDIVEAAKRNNIILSVCYVLHYSPCMKTIKDLIDSGAVGDVVNIQHTEQVGYWHFAHAYVRGNWCLEQTSTFSLLAKCCHDIDLLTWWMGKYKCTKVSSFGSLFHFKKENQPPGAASRCLDCQVEQDCCYSAKRFYLGLCKEGKIGWPVSVLCDVPSIESITDALRHGPYGRCVYDSDNDVCDNQVVSLSFNGGRTATLTMMAFTETSRRAVRVFGTKGEINLNARGEVHVSDFLSQKTVLVDTKADDAPIRTTLMGHDRADFYLLDTFVQAVASKDPSVLSTTPEEILATHLLTFKAERSRREARVVSLDDQ